MSARDLGRDSSGDTVVTTHFYEPVFWQADDRDLRPEFRGTWIAQAARAIHGVEAGDPMTVLAIGTLIQRMNTASSKNHITPAVWIDFAKFHLAKVRRWAEPSLLQDSVEDLEWCLEHTKRKYGANAAKHDGLLTAMLGVALYRRGGRDEEAAKLLQRSLLSTTQHIGPKNHIWARSYLSRVYRRLGKTGDANRAEEQVKKEVMRLGGSQGRRVLLPYVLDDGEEINSIVKHIGPSWFTENKEIRRADGSLISILKDGRVIKSATLQPNPDIAKGYENLMAEYAARNGGSTPVEVFRTARICSVVGCGKTEDLKQCVKCKKTWYCGREHQTYAWKNGHKAVNCDAWRDI